MWKATLPAKAQASVLNAINHTKTMIKKGKTPTKVAEVSDKDALVEKALVALQEKPFDDSYCREWLCFILLGKPAGNRALQSYNSGKGDTKKRVFSLTDFQENRDSFNKKGRRNLDASDSSVMVNPPTTAEKPAVGSINITLRENPLNF
jgi:hypothetical protein